MKIQIELTHKQWELLYRKWNNCAKLRKKNTLEYLKDFNKRVFLFGLKHIKKRAR